MRRMRRRRPNPSLIHINARHMRPHASQRLSQQATAAYTDGRYVEAILALDERARHAPEQTDLMMLRGWCYYKLGRYPDARRIFQAVALTDEAMDRMAASMGCPVESITFDPYPA